MANKDQHTVKAVASAIRQASGLKSFAAQILGTSRQTVQNYCKRYPELDLVVQEAKSLTLDVAEHKLLDRVKAGEGWAICFYLKTQGKRRGYVERQELTGKNGAPIQQQTEVTHAIDLSKLSVKQLENLHALLSIATPETTDEPIDAEFGSAADESNGSGTPVSELLPSSLH